MQKTERCLLDFTILTSKFCEIISEFHLLSSMEWTKI